MLCFNSSGKFKKHLFSFSIIVCRHWLIKIIKYFYRTQDSEGDRGVIAYKVDVILNATRLDKENKTTRTRSLYIIIPNQKLSSWKNRQTNKQKKDPIFFWLNALHHDDMTWHDIWTAPTASLTSLHGYPYFNFLVKLMDLKKVLIFELKSFGWFVYSFIHSRVLLSM